MIPFNRPTIAPHQLDLVAEAFASGRLSGDGPFTKRAAEQLGGLHEGASVLLTTSCTAALELSALLLDLQDGDEVIVPSFTFVSSANAFAVMGACIVFVDISPTTFNIDEEQVAAAITSRTRAIVAVSYGGNVSVSPQLVALAATHGIVIVEDNAHGLFGRGNGHPLGTQGQLSTLSFHETKNVTCGEGGALVLNDAQYFDRAEVIREKGTNRSRFFRGMVDKYTWIDAGSSYLLSEINAAVLCAQLDHSETIQQRRADAARSFRDELATWAANNGVGMPAVIPGTESPSHLFTLVLPDLAQRTRFLASTRELGVATTFHYIPLHSSPAGMRFGSAPFGCPVSSNISDRLARLPLFSDITCDEVDRIIETTTKFSC